MPLPTDALVGQFHSHVVSRGLEFDELTIVDALAAYLSSQFLMFAGPSGTGKSSLARALAEFFTDRVAVLEAELGLTRSADFVGYASSITGTPEYVTTPASDALFAIAASPEAPAILVEEANLSVIEGYLAPLTHALSSLAAESISWRLHQHAAPLSPRGGAGPHVLPSVELQPFPRLLATLNVDATAIAPANKVVARSTVMLLESPGIAEAAATNARAATAGSSGSPGFGLARHPGDCWLEARRSGADQHLRDAFVGAAQTALGQRNRVSPRMAQRALQYMAAYSFVAPGASNADARTHALSDSAENAVLHFILPLLDAREFMDAAIPAQQAARVGGLLAQRLARLTPPSEEWAISSDDFWTGLS